MSNIGSEFDSSVGSDVAKAKRFLARYGIGDVIDYDALESAEFGDPGWHAIRDRLIEIPGDGYERIG